MRPMTKHCIHRTEALLIQPCWCSNNVHIITTRNQTLNSDMSQWMSKMANILGLRIHQRLPVLASVYPCSASYNATCAIGSIHSLSKALKKWTSGGAKAPRRLILGLGVSFWTQYMNMAGSVGGNSFIASARQKGAVEEVIFCFWVFLHVEFWRLVCAILMKCCDKVEFSKSNPYFLVGFLGIWWIVFV